MQDQELLAAWAAGDSSAAQQLIARHLDIVHRFFVGKVEAELEDMVQRTFLKCVEKRDSFRGDSTFRAFLLGIARYELLGFYRTQSKGTFDPAVTSLEDYRAGPSSVAAIRDERKLLLAALRRLPFEQQLLLELRYWEQLSSSEVAQVLSIPASTVRDRLGRARGLLRSAMTDVASSKGLAEITMTSFERWAQSVRDVTES